MRKVTITIEEDGEEPEKVTYPQYPVYPQWPCYQYTNPCFGCPNYGTGRACYCTKGSHTQVWC